MLIATIVYISLFAFTICYLLLDSLFSWNEEGIKLCLSSILPIILGKSLGKMENITLTRIVIYLGISVLLNLFLFHTWLSIAPVLPSFILGYLYTQIDKFANADEDAIREFFKNFKK